MHIITGLGDGGAEASLYRLVDADNSNNHVVISLTTGGKYAEKLRLIGVDVRSFHLKLNFMLPFRLVSLARYIKQSSPDVVQTWMYHANLIGGLASRIVGERKVVWGVHRSDSVTSLSLFTRVIVKLNCWLSRILPSQIIFCANSARVEHERIGFSAKKMSVVANGVDLRVFRYEASKKLRNEYSVSPEECLFGMVARYHPVKDHENLLEALARLDATKHPWSCVLVGSGATSDNHELVKKIHERGLNHRIFLLGPRDDIPDVMNAIDVCVLASKSEAFPNVLIEAMACGTPCITTDVGDAAAIVGNNGWVVPPIDASRLSEACGRALVARSSQDWGTRCSESVNRVTSRFSIGKMVAGYQDAWENAFRGSNS